MEYAITTTEISKVYRGKRVVDKVSMNVPQGSVYGLVGENGAGKTTIMRLISDLIIASEGTYSLFGIKNTDRKIYDAKSKLAAIIEAPSLIPSMTAHDNLVYASLYLGIPIDEDKIANIIETVGLNDVKTKKVKNFSLGMRQRIGIGLCLLNDPTMMILDEPMNGLDPEGIASLRDLIIKLNAENGITFLISSHILSELEKVATVFGIISHGKLVKEVTAEQLHYDFKKSIEVEVNNVKDALIALNNAGIVDIQEVNDNTLRIFDLNIPIAKINKTLVEADIEVSKLLSNDETIEEYYLNIMKEAK